MKPTSPASAFPPPPAAVVLLVDDDDDYRGLVRMAVEESDAAVGLPGGVEVREVCHGEAALRFLRREREYRDAPRPSLVLLDMEMPRLDGLSTLRAVKADADLRTVPVVMFSGVDDDATIRQAAAAGANGYAVKPRDVDTLIATINASTAFWLRVHRPARPRLAEGCAAPGAAAA